MKHVLQGALALALVWATAASSQDGPPPVVRAQINLAKAGLLEPYFSSEQFGLIQGRVGLERTTLGAARGPSAPKTGYRDGATTYVVPTTFMHNLPQWNSALKMTLSGVGTDGAPNQVELNGLLGRVDLQYLWFPNEDTMLSAGLNAGRVRNDIVDAGDVSRNSVGLRVDIARKLTANWGLYARSEYTFGETTINVSPTPSLTISQTQGDDGFYNQAELIGSYRNSDLGWIPDSWVVRPVFGVGFQRNFIEATANSRGVVSSGQKGATENYGLVWSHLRVAKEAPAGTITPDFSIGFEREFANDLDDYVKEENYVMAGAGLSMTTESGMRFGLQYVRHQGLDGQRWNQSVTATASVRF